LALALHFFYRVISLNCHGLKPMAINFHSPFGLSPPFFYRVISLDCLGLNAIAMIFILLLGFSPPIFLSSDLLELPWP